MTSWTCTAGAYACVCLPCACQFSRDLMYVACMQAGGGGKCCWHDAPGVADVLMSWGEQGTPFGAHEP